MRVLVVGAGGREHALVLALLRDPAVDEVVCAPGNPGIAAVCATVPLDVTDVAATVEVARPFDYVVVGPEVPLVLGVADALRQAGVETFGPSAAAAQLEGSKAFAKQVMVAAGVPTARAEAYDDASEAVAALDRFDPPWVVKHDGLAAGKGVVVTTDRVEAVAHVRGSTGRVVLEDYLDGPEVSLFVVVTDDGRLHPLQPAQDHKRVGDGDTGPNTGGMGAYTPLPWAPAGLVDDVLARVVRPTVHEMARRGSPFTGLLYVGLALTARGPQVVEFNVRFGDPETQAVLALLTTPLTQVLRGTAEPVFADGAAVTVVLAAEGYPEAPVAGGEIAGLEPDGQVPAAGVDVLHAGTSRSDGRWLASGGRVLAVTATGADLAAARGAAYAVVGGLDLVGGHHRTDIGLRAERGEIIVPVG